MTGDSLPWFCEFDCLKYVKSGSWYFERIKALEFTHPDIFRCFRLGQWAIRGAPGFFKAVGADIRHEQSGQRVSKGPGGHFVVGATHKINVVSEFELIYHEIGAICSILNTVTSNETLQHQECNLQHTFSPGRKVTVNKGVARLLDFTLKHQNPYIIDVTAPVLLHNPYTKVAVDRDVAQHLLKSLENGEKAWKEIRDQRFVKKSVKLFDSMSLKRLPSFNQLPKDKPTIEVKEKFEVTAKQLSTAYNNIEIARERGMDISEILSHDLIPVSPLFLGDLPFPPTKSKIMEEIESKLQHVRYMPDWDKDTNEKTAVMIETMSRMRQLPFKDHSTIGDFFMALINSFTHISSLIYSIHFLLDSYEEFSMKDSERLRRSNGVKGLDIIGMDLDTPIPVMPDRFWASEKNKINTQLLLRDTQTPPHINFVFSSIIQNGELLNARDGNGDIPELNS